MTRDKHSKALRLAERLIARLPAETEEYSLAIKLRGMLIPPLTPDEVLDMVLPFGSIVAKSKRLGISRQYFYALKAGTARPGEEIMARIATLTGVSAERLKEVW